MRMTGMRMTVASSVSPECGPGVECGHPFSPVLQSHSTSLPFSKHFSHSSRLCLGVSLCLRNLYSFFKAQFKFISPLKSSLFSPVLLIVAITIYHKHNITPKYYLIVGLVRSLSTVGLSSLDTVVPCGCRTEVVLLAVGQGLSLLLEAAPFLSRPSL